MPIKASLYAAIFGGVAALTPASAQEVFPSRTMTIIAPFPAGAGGDAAARALANELGRIAGRGVIVENRPGASGIVAAQAAMRAPPDGHTLFLGINTTHAVNPNTFKSLPYSPLGDFAPVTLAERTASVFVVPAKSELRSMEDVMRAAKARPGALNAGVAAATTIVSAALFKKMAGVDFAAVSYQGAPALTMDLVGSRLDFAVTDVINTLSLRNNGDLRALAVTAPARIPALADVPTMEEAGFKGFAVTSWGAYFVPAGTPQPIILKLNQMIHDAYRSPAIADIIFKIGARAELGTPDELRAFVESEIRLWRDLVAEAGLEVK